MSLLILSFLGLIRLLLCIFFASFIWHIWRERNIVQIFRYTSHTHLQVLRDITVSIHSRTLYLGLFSLSSIKSTWNFSPAGLVRFLLMHVLDFCKVILCRLECYGMVVVILCMGRLFIVMSIMMLQWDFFSPFHGILKFKHLSVMVPF